MGAVDEEAGRTIEVSWLDQGRAKAAAYRGDVPCVVGELLEPVSDMVVASWAVSCILPARPGCCYI